MEDKSLNRAKGIEGENEAEVFLRTKGLKIIEKNWCMGKLEIDLIGTIVGLIVPLKSHVICRKTGSKRFSG